MQLDQGPVFRKDIVPWYDSDIACAVTAAAMFVIFLFALDGIKLGRIYSQYHEHQWVPAVIAILSVIVCMSTIIRWVIRKYAGRKNN